MKKKNIQKLKECKDFDHNNKKNEQQKYIVSRFQSNRENKQNKNNRQD